MSSLRHLSGYGAVKLSAALASFGAVYAFTRLLGPEEYGRYALVLSGLALIHTLTVTWAEAANYRFAARAREAGTEAAHFALAVKLMGRSILLAWALMALLVLTTRHIEGYGPALLWVAALIPINTVIQLALEAHRAGHRVGRYVSTAILQVLGGFLAGALIAWQTGLGAAAPFAGMTAAGVIAALREGAWLLRSARGGMAEPGAARAWLAYGVPIAAALVLDIILSASDRFLIALFLGEAAVGAYAAGYGVADKTVLMLCAWPALAASPLIMARYEAEGPDAARQEARSLASLLLLIAVPAAAGLALVAAPLSEAMIGEALRDQARQIIPWIALAGLLNGLMLHYASEAFQLAHRTGLRALLMLVPAGLNIMLNLLLLPTLGLMGAVYATVISYGVGLVLLGTVGYRLVAFPWPLGTALKVGLAALAMWPAVWLVPDFGSWLQLILEAAVGGFTYLLAALALDAGGVRGFLRARLASRRAASA